MKAAFAVISCFLLTAAGSAAAEPRGWVIDRADQGAAILTYDGFADKGVTYEFTCTNNALIAREIGVTLLMDPTDGQKVGDDPGSAMRPGAAVMALFTDRTKPAFVTADAKPNLHRGWDLTINLPLDDPAVRALPKAKAVSLMTTGWTGLAELGPRASATLSSFLRSCGPAR